MLNQAYRDNNNRLTSEREIIMTKRIRAKHKIDRRLRVNLWGRPKSPFNTREYGPGPHGQRRKKQSDFGLQLQAKQKLKGYYGNISEKQFRRYYKEADQRQGDTSENLIGILERRLDAVVYRMKFVPTVFSSRQFINHGHILVNGKRVNIPSYKVKDGDVIEVKNKSRDLPLVLEAAGSPGEGRARLYRSRPRQNARILSPPAWSRRRAVPRADGAKPGD